MEIPATSNDDMPIGLWQTISNVDAWQDGHNIVISYDLTEELLPII